MFYICYRDEDGTHFYYGGSTWMNCKFDPTWNIGMVLYYTEALATYHANKLERQLIKSTFIRSRVMVRQLKR